MATVLWDTNLFIYLFEDSEVLGARVTQLREGMLQRGDQLFATALTVGETLVRPVALGDIGLQNRYLQFFQSSTITLLPFASDAALHYARIRQDRSIKPADAIQLASAAAAGIDLFVTNDDRLAGKIVLGVKFISSLERAPL